VQNISNVFIFIPIWEKSNIYFGKYWQKFLDMTAMAQDHNF